EGSSGWGEQDRGEPGGGEPGAPMTSHPILVPELNSVCYSRACASSTSPVVRATVVSVTAVSGRQVQLVSYPEGPVRPADFRIVSAPVPEPGPGEVLVRNTWTSVDPGMRLRLRAHSPEGYFPAVQLGAAISGVLTVGQVVASRASGFQPGDTVSHSLG